MTSCLTLLLGDSGGHAGGTRPCWCLPVQSKLLLKIFRLPSELWRDTQPGGNSSSLSGQVGAGGQQFNPCQQDGATQPGTGRWWPRPPVTPTRRIRRDPLYPARLSVLTSQGPPPGNTCGGSAGDFSVCQTGILLQDINIDSPQAEKHGEQARRKCQRGDGLLGRARTGARCASGMEGQGQEPALTVPGGSGGL